MHLGANANNIFSHGSDARSSVLRSLRYATLSRSTRSTISERDTRAIRLGVVRNADDESQR